MQVGKCDEKTIRRCAPGLSVRNLMRVGWPFGPKPLSITSRRGGFTKLGGPPLADCMTEKACPLKFQTFISSKNHKYEVKTRTASGMDVQIHR